MRAHVHAFIVKIGKVARFAFFSAMFVALIALSFGADWSLWSTPFAQLTMGDLTWIMLKPVLILAIGYGWLLWAFAEKKTYEPWAALAVLILVVMSFSGCSGSSSPSAPTPPVPQPQPITLTVHVTSTGSGSPLAGVAGELGGATAVTNGDGGLQLQTAPGATQRLNLTGSGIVPRSVMVAVGATREVSVDAIAAGSVDLLFYRQLVRNGFEQPANLQPLRRWTRNPSVYIRTVDEAGHQLDAPTLATVEQTIRATVPIWTNGQFRVEAVERGTETREGTDGWLTVKWSTTVAGCGQAQVGQEGGFIEFQSQTRSCRFGTSTVAPTVIRHELGHAMGFWHTDADLMKGGNWTNGNLEPSARERAAAAIAYARPVGNADPDQDPASVVTLAPMRVQ